MFLVRQSPLGGLSSSCHLLANHLKHLAMVITKPWMLLFQLRQGIVHVIFWHWSHGYKVVVHSPAAVQRLLQYTLLFSCWIEAKPVVEQCRYCWQEVTKIRLAFIPPLKECGFPARWAIISEQPLDAWNELGGIRGGIWISTRGTRDRSHPFNVSRFNNAVGTSTIFAAKHKCHV